MKRIKEFIFRILAFLKANIFWLKLSLIILAVSFAGGIITFLLPQFNIFSSLIKSGIEQVSRLSQEALNLSFLGKFLLIFKNNIIVATIMLFGGLAIGIPTFFILVFNGLILGFFSTFIALSSLPSSVKLVMFLTLIPHALIELTFIVISASFGFKIGLEYIKSNYKGKRKKIFKNNLYESLLVYLLVILGLVLAALIEVIDIKIIEFLLG